MTTSAEAVATPLTLGPADAGRAVSDAEFASAEYETPWRYELVGGKLVVMSPNSEDHDDAAEPWRDAFVGYKLTHRDRVQKVVSEAWVRAGTGKSRIGDVAVYLVGERSGQKRPERVPELVVEVVSPGHESWHRDAVEKRSEYHALGVSEYVLVDYTGGRVLVLTHAPGDYQERTLTVNDSYTTPLLPGLVIRLEQVLRRADSQD
ncbi:MAG: Uma2 family endonuclease [Isosphaeraceae bacterium]|nr:Uma2 family endonuclease [Isosphaeraceae bacterium]